MLNLLLAATLSVALSNPGDYVPGHYANVRARAANTMKYAHSPNRMFEKIAAGRMPVGGYVSLSDPQVCEIAGMSGLDFVWIDMEHGAMTVADIKAMQMALEGTGCASLVRVRCEDPNHVKPILDIGVDGIIFPQISGYDAAVRAVEACRYPQAGGRRGICIGRQAGYGKTSVGDYLKRSETWPMIVIELEDEKGLAELDRILTLKDVDAIMVGRSDLSCSMGGLYKSGTPEVARLVEAAAAKTCAAGKLFFAMGSIEKAREIGAGLNCGSFDVAVLGGTWRKLAAEGGAAARAPKISVFSYFVRKVAKERGVPLAQAADLLYALGVRGFDCGVFDKDVPDLAATKLKPINFYYFVRNAGPDAVAATNALCLARAKKYGVPRVMTIPPDFTDGGDPEAEIVRTVAGMKAFVAQAKAAGVTITVEDFGGTKNPCSYAKYLKRMLDEIPDLRYALDSGNLYYAGRGEDILDMMAYAKGRIAHVHLKDQTAEDNRKFATLGLGAVPNEKIVRATWADGYDGWYTLENPVGDTYVDTARQITVLKAWTAGL